MKKFEFKLVVENDDIKAYGDYGTININEPVLVSIQHRSVVIDKIVDGIATIRLEQNTALLCEPLSEIEFADIIMQINDMPDMVYNVIANDGTGYVPEIDTSEVTTFGQKYPPVNLLVKNDEVYVTHGDEPINCGPAFLHAEDDKYKSIHVEAIVQNRLVITDDSSKGARKQTVIKRNLIHPELNYAVEVLPMKETFKEQPMFLTGDMNEFNISGEYAVIADSEHYVAIKHDLPWVGSVDNEMVGNELYTVCGVTVYETRQDGTHISPADHGMIWLVHDHLAMSMIQRNYLTLPTINCYNKAGLYGVSITNRIFLNDCTRDQLKQFYNPRYTVIVGDFIIDTDFEYEYSDYEPTEYRVIGSTVNFQLLEVFTDELSDGFCMNNGKPAIAFNYDQRQYLYIRTETIRERNDTFSTDDIYAGSRRSDIRRGSR